MKLTHPLAMLGVIVIAAASLVTSAEASALPDAQRAPGSLVFQLDGKFYSTANIMPTNTDYAEYREYATLAEASTNSVDWVLPALGATESIPSPFDATKCLTVTNGVSLSFQRCGGGRSQQFTLEPTDAGVVLIGPDDVAFGPTHWIRDSFQLRAAVDQAAAGTVTGTALESPFELGSPAIGATVREGRPVFSGVGLPGSVVEVEDEAGHLVASTVVAADATWAVRAERAFVEGSHAGAVRQVSSDDTVTTVPYAFTYALVRGVDVTSPAAGSSVNIPRPVISGTGEPGASIELLFAGVNERSYTTTVTPAGAWRVSPTVSLQRGLVEGQVTQSFEGEIAQVGFSFTYGVVAPVAPVTLVAPGIGSTVTDARPSFSGTGEDGATIEVVEDGSLIARGTVADGRWTAKPSADLAAGKHEGRVVQLIAGVEQSSTPFSFTRRLPDETRQLVVERPAQGGEYVVDGKGTATPLFSGTATPGADIQVRTAWGVNAGSARADVDGRWSITWNKVLAPGRYVGGSTIQSIGGRRIDQVSYSFSVVHGTQIRRLSVTAPAIGGEIGADDSGLARPVFTGMGTPNADIRIVTAWGNLVGSTQADATGAWSITWSKALQPGAYRGGNTIQTVNSVEIDRVGYSFAVRAELLGVRLVSPALGGVVYTGAAETISPTFTGTEGARIEIVGAWGTQLGRGVVRNGAWQITWANRYRPGTYSGGLVKQYLEGETVLDSTAPYRFTILAGLPAE
ncbi:MAG TPA: Ig-like domain-containing protein [Plantibacter sp.]|uniref:Ig-like domain-containing protein n=1 Tax=Plantibacter sp. TaxID=1871045 RepID=UPI002BDA3D72|nr:Ig-like domain-containing protein [Plantibacter sp.]